MAGPRGALSALLLLLLGCFFVAGGASPATDALRRAVPRAAADGGLCEQLLLPWGYPCTEHTVETKDGFLLSLQHIPHGKNRTADNKAHSILWVTDFPMFEWNSDEQRYEVSLFFTFENCAVIRKGTFAKYDYGLLGNLRCYGRRNPPPFDLSSIPESLPIWMGYGGLDALADVTDVHRTIGELRSTPELLYIGDYGHIDFVMSVNAKDDVYDDLIRFLRGNGLHSSY